MDAALLEALGAKMDVGGRKLQYEALRSMNRTFYIPHLFDGGDL